MYGQWYSILRDTHNLSDHFNLTPWDCLSVLRKTTKIDKTVNNKNCPHPIFSKSAGADPGMVQSNPLKWNKYKYIVIVKQQ